MFNIFDIANVSTFIEKSNDNSIISSWNRIKKEAEKMPDKQNDAIARIESKCDDILNRLPYRRNGATGPG
jgi:hypothetical protein